MSILFKDISSLITVKTGDSLHKVAKEMREIDEINDGAILFDEKIIWVGSTEEAVKNLENGEFKPDNIRSLRGKTILPGFVDSHTHIVYSGNRSNEFGMRLRGATYQEIAESGGGILSTVRATRESSQNRLISNAKKHLAKAISHGTTSIEIKSGYGLNTKSEIKMLKVIGKLNEELPIDITATFLGAHDFPQEYANKRDEYVKLLCDEMIPAVASENLAEYCDAFVDKGYYTYAQGMKIFETAKKHGLKVRVHADELANVRAAELAAESGAVSADHLLYISEAGIDSLWKSGTIATLLPGTAYFIRMPYAPARQIIDSGVITALASDCNPGSCFTENMQMILSLAVINMRMTAEEAICATTINGAAALGKSLMTGSLEAGKNADFVILDVGNYIEMFYHFGINHVEETWIKGKRMIPEKILESVN